MSLVGRANTEAGRFTGVIRCAILGAFLGLPAHALNPDRLVSQYAHSAWRMQDGYFTASPYSIAQTTDGYIWIGTTSGILRFDGVRFQRWAPPGGARLESSRVYALFGASDGSLWIGTEGDGLWQWHDGRLNSYVLPGFIMSLSGIPEHGKQSIWVTVSKLRGEAGSICEVGHGQLQCYGQASGLPHLCCNSLATDIEGDFWVGAGTAVVRWRPRSSSADRINPSRTTASPEPISSIAFLADGSALIGFVSPGRGHGLQQVVKGVWRPFRTADWNGSSLGVLTMLRDLHGTLWVGTNGRGLYRIRDGVVSHLGSAGGLSDDSVIAIFEDREGDLWVTTPKGVDCFRDLSVSTFSKHEGLSGTTADGVLAARSGTVWVAGDGGLDALGAGGISSLRIGKGLPGRQVTSLFEDSQSRLWVGIDDTMSILRNGIFTPITRPGGRPLGFVTGIAEDIDHDIWVAIRSDPREVVRLRGLQVKEVFPALAWSAARKVAADPSGGVWLGLVNGDLARYRQGKIEVIHFQHQQDSRVNELSVNSDGSVLGATPFGLIGWRKGKQRILSARNGLPCESINTLIRAASGALWLYTQCGLVEIPAPELEKWWQDAAAVLQMRVFDSSDGVQAGFASFQGAARSIDGKLWFANTAALQMIDPIHVSLNTVPPPVHVEEVITRGHAFSAGTDLRFPALTGDLSIRYTALSFVSPQKVRFRYRLEGQDKAWQEAGTRREAFYTNLAPRSYRFRVIACNNDGLWNDTGDAVTFTIAPAYYQTNWFRLLCAGAFAGALRLFYLLRMRQATDQVQQRLDGRLEERGRIARELHDTLLQGFQGLILRFHAVMKVLPEHQPAHQMMQQALDRADGVLLEGRQRVHDLRSMWVDDKDLPHSLSRCGEDLAQGHAARFSMSILGTMAPLDSIVSAEAYCIAREALSNAFQHAQASRIEGELTYGPEQVCLRIRDDGTGIDPLVLNGGKMGHWGLSGMRERAEKIGAKLSVWSHSSAGTEIELSIPGKVAYLRTRKNSIWLRIGRRGVETQERNRDKSL